MANGKVATRTGWLAALDDESVHVGEMRSMVEQLGIDWKSFEDQLHHQLVETMGISLHI